MSRAAAGQSTVSLDSLRTAPEPAYDVVYSRSYSPTELRKAKQGMVRVHDRDFAIRPTVDWETNGPPTFRAYLHSLFFLDPLLKAYATTGDIEAFALARDTALDWVEKHPLDASPSTYAWNDKATGDRAPYLAYLLRLGLSHKVLSDSAAVLLLNAVALHADALTDSARYSAKTNHGLFQDQGLLLLAKYMGGYLANAGSWRDLAQKRLRENLESHLDWTSGLWLEHSTAYQTVVVNILRRLRAWGLLDDMTLRSIQHSMEDATAWLISGDGFLAQVGDTDLVKAPKWVGADAKQGLNAFMNAGWAAVRHGDSSLFVAASHHSKTHKHSDDLSFELCEVGEKVLIDPGLYAYDAKDPLRKYALSPQAHNSLIVDDEDLNVRKLPPYGSGLIDTASSENYFEITAINPHLQLNGVEHRRRFEYRPARFLRITDELSSQLAHTYKRYFHFAPHLKIDVSDDAITLAGKSFTARLRDRDGTLPRFADGCMFPGYRETETTRVAIFENHDSSATFTIDISFERCQ